MTQKDLELFVEFLTQYNERFEELIKKYSPAEFEALDDGEERIARMRNFFNGIQSRHAPEIIMEYSYETLTASFSVKLADMNISRKLLKELAELADIIDSFYVIPIDNVMFLNVEVRYFKGDKTPEELARQEVIDNM